MPVLDIPVPPRIPPLATDDDAAALAREFQALCRMISAQALALAVLASTPARADGQFVEILTSIDDRLAAVRDELPDRRRDSPLTASCCAIATSVARVQREIKDSLRYPTREGDRALLQRLRALSATLLGLFSGTPLVAALTNQACANTHPLTSTNGGICNG